MFQEVQRAAAAAMKELTANEKKQVGLEERRKHAKAKAKKLEKSLKDVKLSLSGRESIQMLNSV